MFYFPLKLRRPTKQVVPKGPDFNSATSVEIEIGDSLVVVKLPPHRPSYHKGDVELFPPQNFDIYNSSNYEVDERIGTWQIAGVMYRGWPFIGPSFTGKVGSLSCGIRVLRHENPDRLSLFAPSVLEKTVTDLLTLEFGEEKFEYEACWQAPVNWRVHHSLPVPAISFDILPTGGGNAETRLVFPIVRDTILSIEFPQHQNTVGGLEEKDALISRAPMQTLIRQIIDSVQVTLSPESQEQLNNARAQHPTDKLSESMEPLKWTTDEEDQKAAEYRALIES